MEFQLRGKPRKPCRLGYHLQKRSVIHSPARAAPGRFRKDQAPEQYSERCPVQHPGKRVFQASLATALLVRNFPTSSRLHRGATGTLTGISGEGIWRVRLFLPPAATTFNHEPQLGARMSLHYPNCGLAPAHFPIRPYIRIHPRYIFRASGLAPARTRTIFVWPLDEAAWRALL